MSESGRKAVSVAEAAAMYDVSQKRISTAIHAGDLSAKRIGRGLRIDTTALAAWFDGLPDA